jgi:hypothetical protein
MTAEEKLAQFEEGERAPTRNQLAKFAAVYRRPLDANKSWRMSPQRNYRSLSQRPMPRFDP